VIHCPHIPSYSRLIAPLNNDDCGLTYSLGPSLRSSGKRIVLVREASGAALFVKDQRSLTCPRHGNQIMSSDVGIPHCPYWLTEARQLLDRDFRERLTTTHIARTVGVHPVYLAQMFQRHFNCGVIEYLLRRRIAFACRELRASGLPIADIAIAAGFYDQGHFSRTFKRLVGLTPSAYRRRYRGRPT
jgi:AraC-like DNA-binding protein